MCSFPHFLVECDAHLQNLVSEHEFDFLFPGVQGFFYRFLASCDRYRFNMLVMERLAAKITELSSHPHQSHRTHHHRSTLTARAVKLMHLSKFLGLLMFSPQWPAASLLKDQQSHGPALSESIHILEQCQPIIDVNSHLLNALASDVLDEMVCSIPWACELLKMLQQDFISRENTYYRRSFSLVAACARRVLQHAKPSHATLCILSCIEELFSCLEMDMDAIVDAEDLDRDHGFEQLVLVENAVVATAVQHERICFSSCTLFEEIVQLLRQSRVQTGTTEPSRIITPSRREAFKTFSESSASATDASPRHSMKNVNLRSGFFLQNSGMILPFHSLLSFLMVAMILSEFATTIPFILEQIVPNVVENAINNSVDGMEYP